MEQPINTSTTTPTVRSKLKDLTIEDISSKKVFIARFSTWCWVGEEKINMDSAFYFMNGTRKKICELHMKELLVYLNEKLI